ncbi:MAG: plasmid stabilization system [Sphingomonas bacterium]|uniref:type II toxin-antitoxin system RelE/ParE family toxin n=1 Tax=Sphingomonas bacterium TaxID=1895847 RepID=UPI00263385E2|nr:type II toxin-antitoxin system RelE/ParE family toxin [Sphingomonas bacterium]MDB5709322.1 plasmid stabilization system [Sphingomonas bacterium]
MTFAIRRLPAAIADLDAVWDYIAQDNPDAADQIVARIATATRRLADFPSSGTRRPDIHPTAHSVPMGAYLILYRVNEGVVEIVRVLHSARDLSLASPDFTNASGD